MFDSLYNNRKWQKIALEIEIDFIGIQESKWCSDGHFEMYYTISNGRTLLDLPQQEPNVLHKPSFHNLMSLPPVLSLTISCLEDFWNLACSSCRGVLNFWFILAKAATHFMSNKVLITRLGIWHRRFQNNYKLKNNKKGMLYSQNKQDNCSWWVLNIWHWCPKRYSLSSELAQLVN